jgi:hypothetical protein
MSAPTRADTEVKSLMGPSFFWAIAAHFFRWSAEQSVEHREQLLDARTGDPVPERLAFAPVGDDLLVFRFARCCDRTDCDKPAASASEVTFAPLIPPAIMLPP